jgi:formylmethanofuran dehydrogenase subunit E
MWNKKKKKKKNLQQSWNIKENFLKTRNKRNTTKTKKKKGRLNEVISLLAMLAKNESFFLKPVKTELTRENQK